jgi:valyl-tRNA synthetase
LEALKVLLAYDDSAAPNDTKRLERGAHNGGQVAMWIFFEYLSLLHPIMPSITSQLAKYFGMHACLTNHKHTAVNIHFKPNAVGDLWQLIDEVRSLKGLLNISGGAVLKAYLKADPAIIEDFQPFMDTLKTMTRLEEITVLPKEQTPANSLPCVVHELTLYVAFDAALDVIQAKQILSQKHEATALEARHLEQKLQNIAYQNAKPEQWQEDQALFTLKSQTAQKLASFLQLLE